MGSDRGSQCHRGVQLKRRQRSHHSQFLNADGTPKAAKDIWSVLAKAGVPRYAEVVLVADTPGEAAVNYVVFRLMGFPDVKVWVP